MQPGKRRHQISVLQPTEAKDASGFVKVTHAANPTPLRASIKPLGGTSAFNEDRHYQNDTFEVNVRYPGYEITTEDQIRFEHTSVIYQIESVRKLYDVNREVVIICEPVRDSDAPS
jgi:head-tail adaptor